MRLSRLPAFPAPRPELEQVATPAAVAATVLYTALGLGDVSGKRVLDLGCGTGTFAAGAAMLGASQVCGVELDSGALELARDYASRSGLDIEWVLSDVKDYRGSFDVVFMNPPFGAQNRGADRPFLECAARCAPVAYTLHLARTRAFVVRFAEDFGMGCTMEQTFKFPIPHLFTFHRKESQNIEVVLLRLERTAGCS